MEREQDIQTLIQAVERADSAPQLVETVQSLAQAQHKEAIPTLIKVLGYNNPGAAVAAVDGLITLGEMAVSPMLESIDGYNYGARAWAIRACASIGDLRALPVLLEAAKGDFALSVRRAATKGLGNINWSGLPENKQKELQKQVVETLFAVSQDPEWIVRYAAVVALEAWLKGQPSFQATLLSHLQAMRHREEDLTVSARIHKALLLI